MENGSDAVHKEQAGSAEILLIGYDPVFVIVAVKLGNKFQQVGRDAMGFAGLGAAVS
jgi:hypothetical protein